MLSLVCFLRKRPRAALGRGKSLCLHYYIRYLTRMQVQFLCGVKALSGLSDRRKAKSGAPAQLVLRGRALKLYAAKKDTRKKGVSFESKIISWRTGARDGLF